MTQAAQRIYSGDPRRASSLGLLAIGLFFVLAGCGRQESDLPTPELTLKESMNWVLDPAADVIWASAGSIITADGETDLSPTDDAGWDSVRNSAAVIIDSGYQLALPGRAYDQQEWSEISAGLVSAGRLALDAATRQDKQALFDAGGRIYNVCVSCHQQYIPPDIDDSANAEDQQSDSLGTSP